MVDLMDVLTICSELSEDLSSITQNDIQRSERITKHLNIVETKLKYVIPDFEKDLPWFNTPSPLSLAENFRGNIVILDFFTYCCINCMHVLPDLEAVEQMFSLQDGIIVIGVHSAKFENEKVSANILSAILRYHIAHPVVNDHDAVLWNKLQIQCWPTFVVLGPEGQFLHTYVGEGHRENLLEFIHIALEYYKEKVTPCQVTLALEKDKVNETPLQYPGRICVMRNTITVSDSGHHRILLLSSTGIVQHCIGGKDSGFRNGSFSEARFNSPQGVVMKGEIVYVADTNNHAIREIDLGSRCVRTLVGTGLQGHDKEGGKSGTDQELSSPWGLALGKSPGSEEENLLFIAMAGTHQIWVYFIQDGQWLKGSHCKAGTCLRFSGSGQEENRNNSYPAKAGFAQPSGLALSYSLGLLFVADSESSTIRKVSLTDGGVKALVGGEFDPMNLFAYGDQDGKGYQCKLQHPLDVAMVIDAEGPLIVADSYNHKIKSIDIKSQVCKTIVAHEGKNGIIPCPLNEPGGLAVRGQTVYIADTNNHKIRVLDLESKTVSDLPVIFPRDETDSTVPVTKIKGEIIDLGTLPLPAGSKLTFSLEIKFKEGTHLTGDAPSSWILFSETNSNLTEETRGAITQSSTTKLCEVHIQESDIVFYCQCKVLHCGEDNVCRMSQKTFIQAVVIDPSANHLDSCCHIVFSL